MKNFLFTIALLLAGANLYAQESLLEQKKKELEGINTAISIQQKQADQIQATIDSLTPIKDWKTGAFAALNFNSVGLTDWAAGGIQSNSVTLVANAFANYKKGSLDWSNNLDLAYGILRNEGEAFRKNEDKIDYFSKLGYRASDKLNYAVLANFKSQFAPGFDFTDLENPEEISRFLSPAFINLSLGMDLKVKPYLSVYLSPVAGKFSVVTDDSIAAKNIYIPSTTDVNGIQYYNDKFRAELGVFMNILYNQNIGKHTSIRSRLDLFNNYTDKNVANRRNIDVNWETQLNMRITKYIGLSLFTHVIYDNDILVPTEYNQDQMPIAFGPRLQFKRAFGIGLSYKI